MSFLSFSFVMFLIIVLLLYFAGNKNLTYQKAVLLIVSYIFYALLDIRFMGVLLLISLWSWYIAKRCSKKQEKTRLYVSIGCIGLIGVLAFFKYCNYVLKVIDNYIDHSITFNILMPIGLSFYVFQAISYVCDVVHGKVNEKSLLDVCLYIGFFPQIVSGPIVKARDFFPQMNTAHKFSETRLIDGGQRFLVGAFEKMVIADRLSIAVGSVYSAPAAYSGVSLCWAVIAYSLQIYYDFAGYSNMAIAVAYILGFDYGDNFDLPYIASNPSDFWRRWHISLSSWLKEYLYIPLGGSRKGRIRKYINLMIVMLVSGLWHGSSLTFLIWGVLHGLASIIHSIWVDIMKKYNIRLDKYQFFEYLSIAINYIWVSLLWIPFRTQSVSDTIVILKRIFTNARGIQYIYIYTVIFFVFMAGVGLYAKLKNDGKSIWKPLKFKKFSEKVIFCIFVIIIFMFAYMGENAFIYAQF